MKLKIILAALLLLTASSAQAQFVPTKAQHEKLVKQKAKVVALQVKTLELQNAQYFEMQQLLQICREIALDNKWPADVTCTPDSLVFSEPPSVTHPPVTPPTPPVPPPTAPVPPAVDKKSS